MRISFFWPTLIFIGLVAVSAAPEPTYAAPSVDPKHDDMTPEQARANFARKIVLALDDVRSIPDAPNGFNTPRSEMPHGRIEPFEYDSHVTGTRRKANLYLPPGYSAARAYPVLYLLHGVGGDETEWLRWITPNVILDNLLADHRAVPMILVLPNGRALANDRAPANPFTRENAEGFSRFEDELLDDLIPAVEAHYSVLKDRQHRGIVGYSMGGGQALNFGLTHLDRFAWVGAFSSAPDTRPPADLIKDPEALRTELSLLYLSSGRKDGLINISQGVHTALKANNIAHLWNVDDYGHEASSWANNFEHFAQRVFHP